MLTPIEGIGSKARSDVSLFEKSLAPVGRAFNDLGLGPIDSVGVLDRVLREGGLLRL